MKVQIKNRWNSAIIYEGEWETVAQAILAAVKSGADLSGADLYGADLSGARGINPHLSTHLLMLHEQPGAIRAYKLTGKGGGSPMSNNTPRLWYRIGAVLEIADASTDVNEHCGAGINLCTLGWAIREWKTGWRIFVCEFTAADIAAIPTATDGKFRVRRCTVVAEKNVADYGLGVVVAKPSPVANGA